MAKLSQAIALEFIYIVILFTIHNFSYFPDSRKYIFTDYSEREEGSILFEKYQKLNKFLKIKFAELIMYKFTFWDYTHIFIVGQSVDDDWVGLRLTSEFDYNP